MTRLQIFEFKNQESLDYLWNEYVWNTDWGSGEDFIRPTEAMYWDFVDELLFQIDEGDNKYSLEVV